MSRILRVESLLKEEISKIIQQDFKYNLGLISITAIKLAKDLSEATIYYSHFGSTNEKRKAHEKLTKATYFVQKKLNKAVRLKRIPVLTFQQDDSLERGTNLIDNMNSTSYEQ